ncbi:MAG: hypothetical protein VW339_14635, partial [Quisquiliibacterium sp.]
PRKASRLKALNSAIGDSGVLWAGAKPAESGWIIVSLGIRTLAQTGESVHLASSLSYARHATPG